MTVTTDTTAFPDLETLTFEPLEAGAERPLAPCGTAACVR